MTTFEDLKEMMRKHVEQAIMVQNEVLRRAFKSTFGKEFDPNKVFKPNLRRYMHDSGFESTIHWAYHNRVFLVEKNYVDLVYGRVYSDFTVPKKMFVRKENGKFKFVGER